MLVLTRGQRMIIKTSGPHIAGQRDDRGSGWIMTCRLAADDMHERLVLRCRRIRLQDRGARACGPGPLG